MRMKTIKFCHTCMMHLLECMKSLFYFPNFSFVILTTLFVCLFFFFGWCHRSKSLLTFHCKKYIYFSCFVKIIFMIIVIGAVHRAWKIETTRLTQCPGDQVTGFWALRIMGLGWVAGPMILIRWNQLSWIYILKICLIRCCTLIVWNSNLSTY